MEVLQCYNPHRTERLSRSKVLQRCYKGATGATRKSGKREIEKAETGGKSVRSGGLNRNLALNLNLWGFAVGGGRLRLRLGLRAKTINGDATCCEGVKLEWERLLLASRTDLPFATVNGGYWQWAGEAPVPVWGRTVLERPRQMTEKNCEGKDVTSTDQQTLEVSAVPMANAGGEATGNGSAGENKDVSAGTEVVKMATGVSGIRRRR